MTGGGGDGDDTADILGAEVGPLEHKHAAEGTSDTSGYLGYAQIV